ncbi:MAG: hypothetical protein V9G10_11370 [Candidatus Nanopelagicales bacterium]
MTTGEPMAGWRTKLAGLLHEQLAPLYTAQEDQAQTLDRVRRSHEEVLGSQQEALHSLRQTQEVVEQLTQESARVSGELLSLVHEIYGPAGPATGPQSGDGSGRRAGGAVEFAGRAGTAAGGSTGTSRAFSDHGDHPDLRPPWRPGRGAA